MKTPAELAARLRKMVLAAQHHYSPTGEPMRSIVVSPEWLEDMADAANALDRWASVLIEGAAVSAVEDLRVEFARIDAEEDAKPDRKYKARGYVNNPVAYVTDDYGHEGVSHSISASLPVGTPLYAGEWSA